jgi:hypothetical protein
MDDQLKRTLNDKLGGLRAADLLPDFDQGRLWRSIEEQLGAETPARRAIPVWRYAAAAALAGILIGGIATRFLSRNHSEPRIAVIGQRFDTLGPAAIAADAVPVRPKGIPPIQVPAKTPPGRSRAAAAPTTNIAGIQQKPASQSAISSRAQTVMQQPAPATQQPEQIAAAAQIRRKPRAVHIMDIDAQSRTAILNEEPGTPGTTDLMEVITVRTMPEPGARQAPSSVFRHP